MVAMDGVQTSHRDNSRKEGENTTTNRVIRIWEDFRVGNSVVVLLLQIQASSLNKNLFYFQKPTYHETFTNP